MMISKDDYILRRISKISKKKWEFFVITRVIHKLDDPEIEFTTQQLVRRGDGTRALTDMYFPQFQLHLEIDEAQHLDEKHAEADRRRTEDIVTITQHQVHRIQAAMRIAGDRLVDRKLDEVKKDTDGFVEKIQELKRQAISAGSFIPWDFETRYDPESIIRLGRVSKSENVLFLRQADALKCFGYEGGNYQRGAWKIPDGSGDMIWFPRLYQREDWDNELTPEGNTIFERPTTDKSKDRTRKDLAGNFDKGKRIVFARVKDPLGYTLYRYVGTFEINREASSEKEVRFDLVATVEPVRQLN